MVITEPTTASDSLMARSGLVGRMTVGQETNGVISFHGLKGSIAHHGSLIS